MPMNGSIVGAILVAVSIEASANGWATFSQHTSMKGYVIAEVGEVSEVQPPFNTKWNENVFQMNGRCFTFPGYMGMWGFGSKAGMLLANAQKDVKLALIESAIGSIKVELQSIGVIKCPSGTNVLPYSDDPEEQLRLLKKRLEELKRK